ncbi:hypothetical protein ABU162_14335 [Paenibacillus thiaminolyticus]
MLASSPFPSVYIGLGRSWLIGFIAGISLLAASFHVTLLPQRIR